MIFLDIRKKTWQSSDAVAGVHKLLVKTADPERLSARLRDLSDRHEVDIALQARAARCQSYQLAVFDMDSTLIGCEVIDELAAAAGVGEAVADITAQACAVKLILMRVTVPGLHYWRASMPPRSTPWQIDCPSMRGSVRW